MRFSLFFLLFAFTLSGARARCANNAQRLAQDYAERERYGIRNDGSRTHPPDNCTPVMRERRMIPLSKRKVGGVNRERYMDADCNVYEWDYQHGRFEKYKLTGSSTLRHEGEVSPVYGVAIEDKADSRRDYDGSNTGYEGLNMKKLCREHSRGMINPRRVRVQGQICI